MPTVREYTQRVIQQAAQTSVNKTTAHRVLGEALALGKGDKIEALNSASKADQEYEEAHKFMAYWMRMNKQQRIAFMQETGVTVEPEIVSPAIIVVGVLVVVVLIYLSSRGHP